MQESGAGGRGTQVGALLLAAAVLVGLGAAGAGAALEEAPGVRPARASAAGPEASPGAVGGGVGGAGRPSLWPLTPGSAWVYRVKGPDGEPLARTVRVLGARALPGEGAAPPAPAGAGEDGAAPVVLLSEEEGRQELLWAVERGGLVLTLRDEEREGAALLRVTTWAPGALASPAHLAAATDGWSHEGRGSEVTYYPPDGAEARAERRDAWRVLAVGETVRVEAGTFRDAVRLEHTDAQGRTRLVWLVPGVGKVREEGERREELVWYDVKAP
jgi:hypothetical protein